MRPQLAKGRDPTAERQGAKGFTPIPIVSLGGTDAWVWRYRKIDLSP